MYLNWVNFPFFVDWNAGGERFGFRGGSLRTVYIKTPDNFTLGAWHILPRKQLPFPKPYADNEAQLNGDSSLKSASNVFLYFHGNAGNRALGQRTQFHKLLMKIPGCHILALDYRGFGDSTFTIPTEETLQIDAMAAFQWLLERNVDSRKIILIGHSLGTGIATHLASNLTMSNIPIGGLMLLSGYSSIPDAAIGYGLVPLLRPFHGVAFLEDWIKNYLTEKFHSFESIRSVHAPILLIHGKNDMDINIWQSKALFLEAVSARSGTPLVQEGYLDLRANKLSFENMPIKQHILESGDLWQSHNVWLLKVNFAGHNNLAQFQIVEDVIDYWVQKY